MMANGAKMSTLYVIISGSLNTTQQANLIANQRSRGGF
jgi:hypothetical protein